jgi:hypothetical protein
MGVDQHKQSWLSKAVSVRRAYHLEMGDYVSNARQEPRTVRDPDPLTLCDLTTRMLMARRLRVETTKTR